MKPQKYNIPPTYHQSRAKVNENSSKVTTQKVTKKRFVAHISDLSLPGRDESKEANKSVISQSRSIDAKADNVAAEVIAENNIVQGIQILKLFVKIYFRKKLSNSVRIDYSTN